METVIPIVLDELVALLERSPSTQWADIRLRLIGQNAATEKSDIDELFGTAEEWAMRNLNVEHERAALGEALRQLGVQVDYAGRHYGELLGMFDVEYAETAAGRDLKRLLDELGHKVRLAVAVHEQILRPRESGATL